MTQDERNQLTTMSRPANEGRLSTHELLAKTILEQQDRITELESCVKQLLHNEQNMLNIMNRFMENLTSMSPKPNPTEGK